MKKTKLLAWVAATTFIIYGFVPVAFAQTSTASVTMNAGSLAVTTPASVTLTPGVGTVANSTTTATATIATNDATPIRIADNRGSGAGWTLQGKSQNLTSTDGITTVGGANTIALNAGSRYDGTCALAADNLKTQYTITVPTGGVTGTATYTVTGGCAGESNQTAVATGTNVSVGSRGLKIDFSGSYTTSDSWKIAVDHFPYTGLTLTTDATATTGIEAILNSSLAGITSSCTANCVLAGGAAGVSANSALYVAEVNRGMGTYDVKLQFSQVVHENAFAAAYSGTVTLSFV